MDGSSKMKHLFKLLEASNHSGRCQHSEGVGKMRDNPNWVSVYEQSSFPTTCPRGPVSKVFCWNAHNVFNDQLVYFQVVDRSLWLLNVTHCSVVKHEGQCLLLLVEEMQGFTCWGLEAV